MDRLVLELEPDSVDGHTQELLGTSISANADGPLNAASRKVDRIALSSEYN